jgi:hypothetical protein
MVRGCWAHASAPSYRAAATANPIIHLVNAKHSNAPSAVPETDFPESVCGSERIIVSTSSLDSLLADVQRTRGQSCRR